MKKLRNAAHSGLFLPQVSSTNPAAMAGFKHPAPQSVRSYFTPTGFPCSLQD